MVGVFGLEGIWQNIFGRAGSHVGSGMGHIALQD
ncbi:MAG: hypothetical protein DDT33_01461 [Firmicutes bacterium]|nr:hypothetical protein [Bacillota bacterium]